MTKIIGKIKTIIKNHGHRFIFGISILLLALLAAWWSVFLNQSIEKQRTLHRENLTAALDLLALQIVSGQKEPPQAGIFKPDERFEIAACKGTGEKFSRPLHPICPHLCIRVRGWVLFHIDDEFRRKKFMLIGESGLLVLLLLLSSIFLFKFIQLEKRSTKEMEEFWGRVTHEIKTPITGVKAFLQSLKNRSLDEDQLPAFVDMALSQVEKQEQLAENILAGSTLRRKNLVLHMVDVDLEQFLAAYFEEHALHLSDAKVDFTGAAPPGQHITAVADTNALKIILDNITDNALRYCSPGLILKAGFSKQGAKAVIRISDNGPGFKAAAAKNIFKAFKCLDSELPDTVHGSGMGLFISKQLAEKMGGHLEAVSEGEGKGARFSIYLDLKPEK
ncbi:MAG: HAMP domain-containing histidine kinase [Candidatus Aminicenantes bacterium]|nr:HAMP domain-containing histidine kinase [Candidatus Aminicenantes bacterium]